MYWRLDNKNRHSKIKRDKRVQHVVPYFPTSSAESTDYRIYFLERYLSLNDGQTVPGLVQKLLHKFRISHCPVLPECIPYPP